MFEVLKGMRKCIIEGIHAENIGGHFFQLVGDLSPDSVGAGIYYNRIAFCSSGDTMSKDIKVRGRFLNVLGTANQNEFIYNTVWRTGKTALNFGEIADSNYMCQNWTIYGNGIEGCGSLEEGVGAALYLGSKTANFTIYCNYFEGNGSAAGSADIVCNSSSIGIGSAAIYSNLFAGAEYNIYVVKY